MARVTPQICRKDMVVKGKKSARQGGRPQQGRRPCQGACRSTAFTLVELLAVLGIIAILVAVLIPALAVVRKMAKETQQKAQLTTIEMGLTAFKNDYGDYPPSHGWQAAGDNIDYTYCGAQTLAEAMSGQDLLGFHPDSVFSRDGRVDGNDLYPDNPATANLKARREPYLELATANAFRLEQLFNDTGPLKKETFVLCDVFGRKSLTIGKKAVKAGAPILYYRANTSSKTIEATILKDRIYDCMDNDWIVAVKQEADGVSHPLAEPTHQFFYEYIRDLKVTTVKWPYRPDSYILISAGADGLYGTGDDIRNF